MVDNVDNSGTGIYLISSYPSAVARITIALNSLTALDSSMDADVVDLLASTDPIFSTLHSCVKESFCEKGYENLKVNKHRTGAFYLPGSFYKKKGRKKNENITKWN